MKLVVHVGRLGAKSPMISAVMDVEVDMDDQEQTIEAIGNALEEYGRNLADNAARASKPGTYVLDESGNLTDPEES